MDSSSLNRTISIIISFVFVFLINVPISWLLYKLKKPLIFLVPTLLLGLTLFWGLLVILAKDWGLLAYLVLAGLSLFGFLSTLSSSVILFFYLRSKDKNK